MNHPTHAVRFVNNWDGQGDIEYRFIFYNNCEAIDYDTGLPLIQYDGDKILKEWELNDTEVIS